VTGVVGWAGAPVALAWATAALMAVHVVVQVAALLVVGWVAARTDGEALEETLVEALEEALVAVMVVAMRATAAANMAAANSVVVVLAETYSEVGAKERVAARPTGLLAGAGSGDVEVG